MVVEEPLLRIGVILAMAGGGVIFLLLMTLMMYACCRGHRARTLQEAQAAMPSQRNISTIYNPAIVYRQEETEVNRLQLQPPVRTEPENTEATSTQETEGRGITPPPPYEEVVCLPLPDKPSELHDYST